MINVNEITQTLQNAPVMEGAKACARVYVQPVKNIRVNGKLAKILKSAGLKITSRPYQSIKAIYVGYDNGTGVEGGKAQALAQLLKSHDVNCYADADMD